MGHNEGPRPYSPQQIFNAAFDLNVSAIRTEGVGDAGAFRVSAFEGGYGYQNITTSAQTLVKTGAGILGSIHVGALSLTSAVRLYDNTVSGGTVIATLAAGLSARNYNFNARFTNGLVVSTGAVADNITVMFN